MKNIIRLLLILLSIQFVYSFNIKSYNKLTTFRQYQSNELANSNSHVYSKNKALVNNPIYSSKSGESIAITTDKQTNNGFKSIKSFLISIFNYIKSLFEQTSKFIQRITQSSEEASIRVVVKIPSKIGQSVSKIFKNVFKFGNDDSSKAKKYAEDKLKEIENSLKKTTD